MAQYLDLDEKYIDPNDIYAEIFDTLKAFVHNKASSDKNYRFYIYGKFNPEIPSPFLNCINNAEPHAWNGYAGYAMFLVMSIICCFIVPKRLEILVTTLLVVYMTCGLTKMLLNFSKNWESLNLFNC